MEQKTSQLLAYGVKGARWYLYTELDLPFNGDDEDDKEWNYTINKKVVDEDGNEVSTSKRIIPTILVIIKTLPHKGKSGNVKIGEIITPISKNNNKARPEPKSLFLLVFCAFFIYTFLVFL